MDARKLYESYLRDFKVLQSSIQEAVPIAFSLRNNIGLDDVYDIRILVEKSRAVLKHIDNVIAINHLPPRGDKCIEPN